MTNSHTGCTRIGLVLTCTWDLLWTECSSISSLTLHSARVHIPPYFLCRMDLSFADPGDGVPNCVIAVRGMREERPGHQPASREGRVRPPLPTTYTTHVWTTSTKGESDNIVRIGNVTHASWTAYDTCLFRHFDWLYDRRIGLVPHLGMTNGVRMYRKQDESMDMSCFIVLLSLHSCLALLPFSLRVELDWTVTNARSERRGVSRCHHSIH